MTGDEPTYHLLPAIGKDGHGLIGFKDGVGLWRDKVEAFFHEIGVLSTRQRTDPRG